MGKDYTDLNGLHESKISEANHTDFYELPHGFSLWTALKKCKSASAKIFKHKGNLLIDAILG